MAATSAHTATESFARSRSGPERLRSHLHRPLTVTFHEVREFVKELHPSHPSNPNVFTSLHVAFTLLCHNMWLQDNYAGKQSENTEEDVWPSLPM
jgi:hypothetical protein